MSTPLGPSTLLVTGLHPDTGETVVRAVWEHGDTLDDLLARHGWAPLSLDDVTGRSAPHEVEIRVVVQPLGAPAATDQRAQLAQLPPGSGRIPHDADLQTAPGEQPHRVQRISVYAVVSSERGVLLTAYSDRTNAPGWIGWPGGGLDPGELPEDGLHREVREETGLDATAPGCALTDWNLENVYDIYPRWRARYAPGVTRNVEHVFGLRVPAGAAVQLNAREHTDYVWLPWRAAADRCYSYTNAEACLLLPRFAQGAAP
jgi:dATP pyrophosphohydrolase